MLNIDAHTLHVTNTEFTCMNIWEIVTQDAKAPLPQFKSEQTDKIFIIEDFRVEVAELATQLVTAIGGNANHFLVYQGNLNKPDDGGQIRLLQLKQNA